MNAVLDRLTGRIYELLFGRMSHTAVCARIRRVSICTESAATEKCRDFYTGMIKKTVIVTFCLVCAVIVSAVASSGEKTIVLERQGYGGETEDITLKAEIDGEETEFTAEVLPLEYTENTVYEAFDKGFQYIDGVYLGENESADCVTGNLNLVDYIDELGLDVRWDSEDYEVISSDGEIVSSDAGKDRIVKLTAIVSYGDYEAERSYVVKIVGSTPTDTDKVIESITAQIREMQLKSDNKELELPQSIDGYSVSDGSDSHMTGVLLVLGLAAIAAVWIRGNSGLKRLESDRDIQLMLAYPGFVDRLTLYLGAGLTVRGALDRLAKTAVKQDRAHSRKNGLCEAGILEKEIKYTLNEIRSGIPESAAYYDLGHRLGRPEYVKLMSLLSRNVKKGTKDLSAMMEEEEHAAMQTRREIAKKKGEEAGTKLLFPMVVLLGIVMLIVVLPAILNF